MLFAEGVLVKPVGSMQLSMLGTELLNPCTRFLAYPNV